MSDASAATSEQASEARPEVEDDEGEEEVERCCRICRGTEEDADANELGRLIRPCACKGSLLYVHEKCQELWIKTYLRRSDKTPACEVCGQQFRISFTQPHKGIVRFLFSSQSPPLVHSIYLIILYSALYTLFLLAGQQHTKLLTFCAMVAVGLGATAALFWVTAMRQVDRQVLAYYLVPTFAFAVVIFSQFMGYASLYYRWLSYPGIVYEEDTEYMNFLKQMNWKSSIGVLLEGISSTSIILNGGLIIGVSSIRLYKFLRLLYRNGGSLANVWMTASDSTRATLIGSLQFCIFLSFYITGPIGKCISFIVYITFVAAVNWLLRSRFSQHVDTGLCRVALALGYSFVSTVLMGIIINHYLLQLAEETGFEAKALASEEFLAATSIQDETVRGLDYNPTRLSGMFAKKFIRYFYDRSAREDHFEYWNQVFYLSFFLLQTLGIFAVGVYIHGRAIWAHFKEWQTTRRQQHLMQLRDELLAKLQGMQRQHQELLDAVRNAPANTQAINIQRHINLRRQFDADNVNGREEDAIERERAQVMRHFESSLDQMLATEGAEERAADGQEEEEEDTEQLPEEEMAEVAAQHESEADRLQEGEETEDKGKENEEEEEEQGPEQGDEEEVVADDDDGTAHQEEEHDEVAQAVGERLQAGARDFIAGVRSIDEIVAHYLSERRTESQLSLFLQYLRAHLSPLTAPEKIKIVYSTLIYLVLFNSVYFSLVIIDPEEQKRVWLRFFMDFVGLISILCFLHFNYLTPPDRPNNVNPAVGENNNNGNNANRNYGLFLIGHALIFLAIILAWITLRPSTFFDPSLRHLHDEEPVFEGDANQPAEDDPIAFVKQDTMTGNLRLDLDLLLLEQASRDPYALHSLKVMSLLMLICLIEYGLYAVGVTIKRLVGVYRIWLHTGTGHFIVHDIAEPAQPQPQPQQQHQEDIPERPQQEDDDEDEDEEVEHAGVHLHAD